MKNPVENIKCEDGYGNTMHPVPQPDSWLGSAIVVNAGTGKVFNAVNTQAEENRVKYT